MVEQQPYVFHHGTFANFDGKTVQYGSGNVFYKQAGGCFKGMSCLVPILVLIGSIVASFAIPATNSSLENSPIPFVGFIGGGIAAWIAWELVQRLWFILVGPTLEIPKMSLSKQVYRGGDQIDFVYRQDARRQSQLQQGVVQFIMRESVRYSCGTDTCYAKHDFVLKEFPVRTATYMPGIPLEIRDTFELPLNMMPTFSTTNNKIGYMIRIELSFDKIPNYEQLFQFQVER